MIKACIFDQDGTLYPKKSRLTYVLREKTKEWISKNLGIERKEVDFIYKKLPDMHPHPYHGFLSLGLSPKDYHREVFDKVNPAEFLKRNEKLIELFSKIKQSKYVATLASPNYSLKLQQILGIDDLVKKTISLIEHPPTYSKSEAYNSIRDALGLKSDEILVIGDDISVDILPAIRNGYEAVLVDSNGMKNANFNCICNIYRLDELLDNLT